MFCIPLTRLAQCAALVAAIISVLLPPQSLICRHCLLNDAAESLASGCPADLEHGVDRDEKECHTTCPESLDSLLEDDHHSHQDCPCCIGGDHNSSLLTSSSAQPIKAAAFSRVWLLADKPNLSITQPFDQNCSASISTPSKPNVLRI
jgi:hypothetical protein